MSIATDLLIAIVVSIIVGALLYLAIGKALRLLLERACPSSNAVMFWQRFTLVMLFLLPILLSVAFGVPSAEHVGTVQLGSVVLHAIIASLIGGFIVMLGMGVWVGSVAGRAPQSSTLRSPNENEFWGKKQR